MDSGANWQLISGEQLQAKLGQVQILDCSVGEGVQAMHEAKHLPGARFLDLMNLRDKTSPFPHMMPTDKAQVQAHLKGLDSGKDVVCYDVGNNMFAARAAIVLLSWGFKKVHVLDGGMKAWKGATESGEVKASDAQCEVEFNSKWVCGFDHVKSITEGKVSAQILDARPGGFANGNIKGSVNLSFPSLLQADNTLKSKEELQKDFAAAGIDLAKPIVMTCGGGIAACGAHLAAQHLGCSDVLMYDGSWAEYSTKV